MKNNKENKLKIFKIFYDNEVIEKCPEYDIVFSEKTPYPFFARLANYTADGCSTAYMASVVKSVENYITGNLHAIHGLFIKSDIEAIILSAVLTRLSQNQPLKVNFPLYESVFLCNHKYYQRTKERDPIKFSYIDIDNDNDEDYSNRIGMPPFPFFFKASELQMSIHQYIIKDCEQLKKTIEQLQIVLPNYNVDTKYISNHYLDLRKYPLATKNVMICEELVSNCLQLNWEGWADGQGNIYTYGFTDEILADKGIFSDFIMPSILPAEVRDKAEMICKEFVKDISLTSSFVNIELWIKKSDYDDIHIIEVNPRSAFSYHEQYQTSYNGANLYNSIIQLSMGNTNIGIIPDPYTNFTGLYSCQSVFATRCDGKISQLLHFINIEQEKEMNPDYHFFFLFQDREFEIINNCQNGARVLMTVFFTKPTYEQVQNESLRLKKLFLIKDTYYM